MISTISNHSESLDLGQLGANSSHHFLGPVHGVLPTGPNGLAAFNTLQASPLDDAQARAVILSYNYTPDHQGLASNVSCIYDTQSPVMASRVPNNTYVLGVDGTCDGLVHVFANETPILTPNTDNTLMFWACMSTPAGGEDPVYYIYLRGRERYATAIGNITCTVSPTRPAIFPVMYQSKADIFSTKELVGTSKPGNITSMIIMRALAELGDIVLQSQSPEQRGGRFLYSTVTNPAPPPSCMRTVNGTLSAEVMGWVAKPVHIGFLMPMTTLNVVALVVILKAMSRSKGGCYEFDPTDPRPLVLAVPSLAEGPSGWTDGVSYRPREVRGCDI